MDVLSTLMSTMAKTASTRMMKTMTSCHGSESSTTRNRPRDRLLHTIARSTSQLPEHAIKRNLIKIGN
jgi:hypothetical protein